MEEHAIPVSHLILPVLLPLRQSELLKETVCTDDKHRSGSLETYATLDADDGVAYVAVTTDAVSSADFLNSLDGLYLVVIFCSVDRYQFTLLETELQGLRTFLGWVLQVCALRQALLRVEYLATADRCAPDTYVVRILQLCEVSVEAMSVEIVYLLLT